MPGHDLPQVLVVDDEPELREMLVDALGGAGLEVTAAASGQEAMDLAQRRKPDLLVTDLCLGDCTGLDVIDGLRRQAGDIPAVVITGQATPATLAEVSRWRPVEMMTKPLDIERLRATVRRELRLQADLSAARGRNRRLRMLARKANLQRKTVSRQMEKTCAELTAAYRRLSGQMGMQKVVIGYQRDLLSARNDDDVFRALFRTYVHHSGPVFGVALVCDAEARLRIVGRFGVPAPDSAEFCECLSRPLIDIAVTNPRCMLLDAGDRAELFDQRIRRYLAGLTVLMVPLMPTEEELIGLVLLYRKGEQPFVDSDVTLAEMAAVSTALTVRRND